MGESINHAHTLPLHGPGQPLHVGRVFEQGDKPGGLGGPKLGSARDIRRRLSLFPSTSQIVYQQRMQAINDIVHVFTGMHRHQREAQACLPLCRGRADAKGL